MTKQQARELALEKRQSGHVVTPPAITDDVLKAHMKKHLEKQEASRLPKPDVRRETSPS